jgi:integrase
MPRVNPGLTLPWVRRLREQIKLEHGQGWSIREQAGKVKLTRRFADGSSSSVSLEIHWGPSCGTAVLSAMASLQERMDNQQLGLAEAHALQGGARTPGNDDAVDWPAVAAAFLESRQDRRPTTLVDLHRRVGLALKTLESRPRPQDGRSLMRAYARQNFRRSPPGGQGRKRHLGDVAALLRFAVTRTGAPARWMPLEGEQLEELIGTADAGPGADELTPPVKPQQLAGLLDHLREGGKDEFWLAVALVGLFGLRPAELAALRVVDGHLRVGGHVKRNRRTMKQPKGDRLVLPLDIPGREGEGQRALDLYASGKLKLPYAIRTAIRGGEFKPVGDAFRQLLDRLPCWQLILLEAPGITPYSLRHGYAWRAHKCYERSLSIRDVAALMGHNPATHHRHYGRWVDDAGLIDAVSRVVGAAHTGDSAISN